MNQEGPMNPIHYLGFPECRMKHNDHDLSFLDFKLHDPKKSQLKVDFLSVPYNQIFDFVTEQFVKILTPACLWNMPLTLKPFWIFW